MDMARLHQLSSARAAPDGAGGFMDFHGQARAGHHNGSSQPVGSGSDDGDIRHGASPARGGPRARGGGD